MNRSETRVASRSPRRISRELILQGLYEYLLVGHEPAQVRLRIEAEPEFKKADQAMFRELWAGIHEQREALIAAVEPCLDRRFDQVSPVERAIILLAAYELAHRHDVPYRVVINEAVELAKSYGGTDGHKWINGVLDRYAPGVRAAEMGAASASG